MFLSIVVDRRLLALAVSLTAVYLMLVTLPSSCTCEARRHSLTSNRGLKKNDKQDVGSIHQSYHRKYNKDKHGHKPKSESDDTSKDNGRKKEEEEGNGKGKGGKIKKQNKGKDSKGKGKSADSEKIPSLHPSSAPTMIPSILPSTSTIPSGSPSVLPTLNPSTIPSPSPSMIPSMTPTVSPSKIPSVSPTGIPSMAPSASPKSDVGHVRVYKWTNEQWMQIGSDINGENGLDRSGTVSLSNDGSIVAIGAYYNDCEGNVNCGHVRVYQFNDNNKMWEQLGPDIDGEGWADRSGSALCLSHDGTILAIGAPYNGGTDGGIGIKAGHVRIYRWNGEDWEQLGSDIDGENPGDLSGSSVSLSSDGTILAIGAPYNDANNSDNTLNVGRVRVYKWNGEDWDQLGSDIHGVGKDDRLGSSVSLSDDGSILAIGAPISAAGKAHVYQWNQIDENWEQVGSDINGENSGDQSGSRVSLSGDGFILAIGAPFNNGVGGERSGHVRVYRWNDENWTQLGSDIDGEKTDDRSGISVSVSDNGTIVAIGAPYNDADGDDDTNIGHVRVYKLNDSNENWDQLGSEDIDGEFAGDLSGISVSLSGDGSILAVGAHFNDGRVL